MAESYPNSNPFHQDDTALDTDMGQQPQETTMGGYASVDHAFQKGEREAAEGIHRVRDTAERAGGRVKSGLSQATNYVKNLDAADMWGDVKQLARRNPGACLLTMAVIGFALGRTTSRNSR